MLAQYQGPRGDTHHFRRNNFVCLRILDDSVLVNPSLLRKRICAHLRCLRRPDSSLSLPLVGYKCSSRTPVLSPKLFLRTASATTTSSRDAFPARSPIPLIVHSICRTPARTAASEFATASPKSSWQCALRITPSGSPRCSRTCENISPYSSGTA